MAMWIKTGAWGNLVIIPNPDRTPLRPLWVMIMAKGEMVPGIEPAILKAAQSGEFAFLNHGSAFHFPGHVRDSDAIEVRDGEKLYGRMLIVRILGKIETDCFAICIGGWWRA
jgi:hypothetical protein